MEEEEMKNKMIVAVSLVAAGVMTYLMFSGLDEGFYHFPWELFAGFGMMEDYPSPAEGNGLENRQACKSVRGFESHILLYLLLTRDGAAR